MTPKEKLLNYLEYDFTTGDHDDSWKIVVSGLVDDILKEDECSCGRLSIQLLKVGKVLESSCSTHDYEIVNEIAQLAKDRIENAAEGQMSKWLELLDEEIKFWKEAPTCDKREVTALRILRERLLISNNLGKLAIIRGEGNEILEIHESDVRSSPANRFELTEDVSIPCPEIPEFIEKLDGKLMPYEPPKRNK